MDKQAPAAPGVNAPEYLIVGQIVAPFGIKGELKVNILTDFPERLGKLGQVVLAPFSHVEPSQTPTGTFDPRPARTSAPSHRNTPNTAFRPPDVPTPFSVRSAHIHKGHLLLGLEGVEDANAAETLRGCWVLVPLEQARKLPRGVYYFYEIIGLDVYTTGGDLLGKVEDVLSSAANDVYIVKGPGVHDPSGELLVPAIKTVVKRIDKAQGRIVIAPVEDWA